MVKLQVNTKEIYLSNLILVISRQHRVSDSEPGDGGGREARFSHSTDHLKVYHLITHILSRFTGHPLDRHISLNMAGGACRRRPSLDTRALSQRDKSKLYH